MLSFTDDSDCFLVVSNVSSSQLQQTTDSKSLVLQSTSNCDGSIQPCVGYCNHLTQLPTDNGRCLETVSNSIDNLQQTSDECDYSTPQVVNNDDCDYPTLQAVNNDDCGYPSLESVNNDDCDHPTFQSVNNDDCDYSTLQAVNNDDCDYPSLESVNNDDCDYPTFQSVNNDDYDYPTLQAVNNDDCDYPTLQAVNNDDCDYPTFQAVNNDDCDYTTLQKGNNSGCDYLILKAVNNYDCDRLILQETNNDGNDFNVGGENLRWNFDDSNHSQKKSEENGYLQLISDDIGNLSRDSGNSAYSCQQLSFGSDGSHPLSEKYDSRLEEPAADACEYLVEVGQSCDSVRQIADNDQRRCPFDDSGYLQPNIIKKDYLKLVRSGLQQTTDNWGNLSLTTDGQYSRGSISCDHILLTVIFLLKSLS